MSTPFKMKGSPMQRNFRVGSPAKTAVNQESKPKKKLGEWFKSTKLGKNLKTAGDIIQGDVNKVKSRTQAAGDKIKKKATDLNTEIQNKATKFQSKVKANTKKRKEKQRDRNDVLDKFGGTDFEVREKIKADKKPGESTYQYKIRKRKEKSNSYR